MKLIANPHCCEEASTLSKDYYIPCNQPAVNIVGWKGRSDTPIRMCQFCSNHNVQNRGAYVVEHYSGSTGARQAWPTAPDTNCNTLPNGDCVSTETCMHSLNPNVQNRAWSHSLNPLDDLSEDQLLMLWDQKKKAIEIAKEEEMDLRKYIVGRAFPKKDEGMNTKELGNGYQLKAAIKYNYNLADNDKVEECLNKITALGNSGAFIADRLVSWKPNFLLTEYRQLVEDKDKGSKFAEQCLTIITDMLTITEAAPSLEIKEPKAKKK